MAKKKLYRTRRPMDYGEKSLDYDQVIELKGFINDEKLVRLRLLVEYDGAENDLVECAKCGAKFVNHNSKMTHFELRHAGLSEEDIDKMVDKLDERLTTDEPIYGGKH
jgi:hypothetical protein